MPNAFQTGESEHQFGNPQCAACDPGWPQQHSEVAEQCCPGLIHAKTCRTDESSSGESKVMYYCDLCYEDDPF
jgi:hypothetical protein